MSILIIDTCVIEESKDYYFKKPKLKLVKDLNEGTIYIPEIVIKEIVSHLHDLHKNTENKIKSINDKLKDNFRNFENFEININSPHLNFDNTELSKSVEDFENNYRKFLNDNNIKVHDLPKNFDINLLMSRIFAQQYPFKEGIDKGTKDFAIWKTVIDIFKNNKNNEVIFLTNNTKAFRENEKIPKDFENDLIENGLDLKFFNILTLQEYLDSKTSIPAENIFKTIQEKFLPQLRTQKYDSYGFGISFDDFILTDADIDYEIGQTPVFGFNFEYEIDDEFEIDESSIKCIDIDDVDLYIEFKIHNRVNVYIKEISVGDLLIEINVSSCYDSETNQITGLEAGDVEILENNIDENKAYDAECIAHANYMASRDRF